MAEILEQHGLDTVVITGTLTNVCSESSARDAMMRNFKTILISDANAAPTDEEHIASLASILQVFGDVYDTQEIVAMLESGAENRTVAAE